MSEERKTEFWWATIAGADCEPVEVVTVEGKRLAYTCGCGDPFHLDQPDCPCILVASQAARFGDEGGPMLRPLTPKQEKNAFRRKQRQLAEMRAHSWRGPR